MTEIAELLVKFRVIEMMIVIWIGVLIFLYLKTKTLASGLEKKLFYIRGRISNQSNNPKRPTKGGAKRKFDELLCNEMRDMNIYYSRYANFTSVLPLWGMLGTVMSLFALAGKMGQEELPIDNFFSALLTTIMGLSGAIVFKSLDAKLSIAIVDNNKEFDRYIDDNACEQVHEVKQS